MKLIYYTLIITVFDYVLKVHGASIYELLNPVPQEDGIPLDSAIQGVSPIVSLAVSSVNGDPHFMITSPSGYRICFDVNGNTGEVMKLIEDSITGLHVRGTLTETGEERFHQSFFTKITVQMPKSTFVATLDHVFLNGAQYEWNDRNLYEEGEDFEIHYGQYNSVDIVLTYYDVIMRVTVAGPSLGVFLLQDIGLSHLTSGVLGQFAYRDFVVRGHGNRGLLKYDNSQTIYRVMMTHHGDIRCWKGFGFKGDALLQRDREDYFLQDLDTDAMGYGENANAKAGTFMEPPEVSQISDEVHREYNSHTKDPSDMMTDRNETDNKVRDSDNGDEDLGSMFNQVDGIISMLDKTVADVEKFDKIEESSLAVGDDNHPEEYDEYYEDASLDESHEDWGVLDEIPAEPVDSKISEDYLKYLERHD